MARLQRNYTHNTPLATSAVTLVPAVPARTVSVISNLTFYNSNTTTVRTVIVYLVEKAGSSDTGTTFIQKDIAPLKTWLVVEAINKRLIDGMTLQADQNTGTDVNANCEGADYT